MCHHLLPIAEDLPYKTPVVTGKKNGLANLYRTFVSRSGFAKHVAKLDMMLPPDTWSNDIVLHLPTQTVLPDASAIRVTTLPMRMQSSLYGGLLIDQVLTLDALCLSGRIPGFYQDEFICPLDLLFGPDNSDVKNRFTLMPAFADLRLLRLDALKVSWALCQLPGLKHLEIDSTCSLYDTASQVRRDSRVERLVLSVGSRLLDRTSHPPYHMHPDKFTRFLHGFPRVRDL